ncbi:tRNA-dihydrouridine(20) synthase[NAD(P)+]-like protein [Euroglyphus maynei]|uniref:tRNA-dihydrouridine(20) synthase[NAD(P)+]-like protein n=1 Tax=Euroglyphus maynei TaxID=6958 RepID=A0A1Y3BDU6_EURMA|nr:tRNA-dihydrouridine(20) synthase[NAD(P)+]-like protein [Euroglyphus maynei]
MVRVGTLPMRLLALQYGADLVYTDEIIDFKLIKSKRYVNDALGTVDFVDDAGVVVFRTCSLEKDRVILQIGTNDPDRAVMAAKMVEDDVAGIDINMGCPKSFSIKGGMGAALLNKPDLVQRIIRSLKAEIRKPISCKIRVFDSLDCTLNLLKLIEEAGANAIAIHGRTVDERPRHPNRNDYIRAASNTLNIPVIANGDSCNIKNYENLKIFQQKTRASSVMVSRSAMKNCSIFDPSNLVKDVEDVIKEYIKLAIRYDNTTGNTKYCILQMLGNMQEYGIGKLIAGARDLKTMSDIYELNDYYEQICNGRNLSKQISIISTTSSDDKPSCDENLIELPIVFVKRVFVRSNYPKTILNRWLMKNNFKNPHYETKQIEKKFHSILHFQGKCYTTPYLETTKKTAEQSAALVIIIKLGLCDDRKIIDTCMMNNNKRDNHSILEYRHQGRTYLIRR